VFLEALRLYRKRHYQTCCPGFTNSPSNIGSGSLCLYTRSDRGYDRDPAKSTGAGGVHNCSNSKRVGGIIFPHVNHERSYPLSIAQVVVDWIGVRTSSVSPISFDPAGLTCIVTKNTIPATSRTRTSSNLPDGTTTAQATT